MARRSKAQDKALGGLIVVIVVVGAPVLLVQKIAETTGWQGQSQEQLRDSLGVPIDTDEKVTRKSRREVWKYHQTGVNVLLVDTASSMSAPGACGCVPHGGYRP